MGLTEGIDRREGVETIVGIRRIKRIARI